MANRFGPEKVLLNRNDFNCSLTWWLESSEKLNIEGAVQSYEHDLHGAYKDNTGETDLIHIEQRVYLFDQPISKEQFIEFSAGNDFFSAVAPRWPLVDIPNGPLATWSEAHCDINAGRNGKTCIVYQSDESLVIRLFLQGTVGPKFDEYMNFSIQKAAENMLRYNKSP